jgi:hypothetical protein
MINFEINNVLWAAFFVILFDIFFAILFDSYFALFGVLFDVLSALFRVFFAAVDGELSIQISRVLENFLIIFNNCFVSSSEIAQLMSAFYKN